MKKFFTLCLAFMLASLLNVNAADTYTLVGVNINGVSWDPAATQNDLVYESATDSYVLTGVTMSGEFKIAKDHAWTTSWGSNGKLIPTGAAYIAWKGGDNIAMSDNQTYSNCTVRFKLLDSEAASIHITSDTAMSGTIDTQASQWCVAGVFADGEHWDDTNVMTDLGNGVYEWWCETLPTEFKFKGAGSWDYNFGIPANNGNSRYTPIMGIENAVDNGGNNIKMTSDGSYDKYRIRLTVRGYVASFRVDGFKEAVPTLTRVFYESFDQNADGTGGNDGTWSGSVANGTWDTAVFDVAGWTATNGYFANKCIKLGAGSKLGTVTSPAIGVTGNGELRFRAGAWNGDATTLNVTINNGGTLSTSSVTLVNNEFTDYVISISDATAESTITFSATKASKNRFFLDEVEVYAVSTPLKTADITMTDGLVKDANTVYYNRNIAIPTYNIAFPEGASSMDIEILKDGYAYQSYPAQTADYSVQFYEEGSFEINVTAWGEGVYSIASKDVTVEAMTSYYSISEFINAGVAGTAEVGYLNFSPVVVQHSGSFLFIQYNGEAGLVYKALDQTYEQGDVLLGFPAKFDNYNNNYQIIPFSSSLGDPYSSADVTPTEVAAGDEWTAFATAANQNKYVLVKGAEVTASTVGGIATYNKPFGATVPEDLTKKYDVEGILGIYNETIQIRPISYTESAPEDPNTYTVTFTADPADGATVYTLDKITLVPSVTVAMLTTEAQVANWCTVTDANGNTYNSQIALQSGSSYYALTIEGATAAGTYTIVVPAKTFVDAMTMSSDSKNYNAEFTLTYTLAENPLKLDLIPYATTPTNGTEVDTLTTVTLWFPEDATPSDMNWTITEKPEVVDQDGNIYTASIDYTDYTDAYYVYINDVTNPGTYTLTIPQGTFGDNDYFNTKPYNTIGRTNPELTYTWTVKAAPIAPTAVTPADGAEVNDLNTTVITFAEAVTVNAEVGAITLTNSDNSTMDYGKNIAVAMSEDGLTATITAEPSYLNSWTVGATYTMSIPAGYFVAASGTANDALSYSWTIAAEPFTYVSTTPANNSTVESLSEILIDFGGLRPRLVDGYSYPTYNLLGADGNTVTTVTTSYSWENLDGTYYYQLKGTLNEAVTTPGTYTLTIPAGVFKLSEASSGFNTNAEIVLTFTIAEPDPFTYTFEPESINPAEGKVDVLGSIIKVTFPSDVTLNSNATMDKNWATLADDKGNTYNTSLVLGFDTKVMEVSLSDDEGNSVEITAAGTYTLTIPKCTAGDETFWNGRGQSGNVNPELVYTWTIEATPIAPTAVTPADGSEVEAPSTITLTFAEAVTVNAEAGELTMVNTSDATWDYATNFNVAISEDGLTATITCEPGYPSYAPRWAIGKTYKLNIPAGYFVAASGATSEVLEYSWTVVPAPFTFVSTTPANGTTVESLSEILICFAQKTYGYGSMPTLNLTDAEGNVVTTATTVRTTDADGNWYAVNVTLAETVTTPGTYTLVVPENVFTTDSYNGDNGSKNAAFDLTFTIAEPDPNTYTLALNVDPADGSTVTALDKIVFTQGTGVIAIFQGSDDALTDNWCTVTDANGVTYNNKLALETGTSGYGLTIEGATAAGTYTVVVPAKTFVDAMTMSSDSKNYNAEMTLTYTIAANDPYTYTYGISEISPAEGVVTELGNQIFITATGDWFEFTPTAYTTLNWIKLVDDKGKTYTTGVGYVTDTQAVVYVMNDDNTDSLVITEPGTYTMTIPQGTFGDRTFFESGNEKGNLNPELVYTWTIEGAVVEDFTPEVNPIAGEVTAEEIKTTVITFPSPIASFDGSNVRYAKNFGSVWYDYAATSTIAEDKMSMTINWDFAPEVGLTYTLELPAGCIVLENGAKNLATNVSYLVVAGPKDMAEFTVPAGMAGWLGYDPSDIDAWAPEFPFTVSTSQNNTISFAATLPSLPTGVTAMEVVNDNNEVIATLNQTGVAPLADGGEEYQVAGETTNEYVEGSELRFRFRFAHAGGTSETILFSYIVAGGTVTGAESIELDGNVIVRGNEIIAPEGSAIYTITGIQVPAEGVAPGVYVVVYGDQAIKVMVK